MMPFAARQIEVSKPEERVQALASLQAVEHPLLILNTCQRLEIFGWIPEPQDDFGAEWRDYLAFERLARIAAGLESRILGELEILGQVRTAYKDFKGRCESHDTTLDRIFQDALALARRARKVSGIDRDVTSLSALAARELIARVPAGAPVAVIGSGSMASSVARYLGKRGKSPVRVTSRCPDRAMTLAMEVGGFGSGLDDLSDVLDQVAGIITATAAPHPVVYPQHIHAARRPLHIVDLGVPPDCHEDVMHMEDLHYIPLETIEGRAHVHSEDRKERAEVAAQLIRDGAVAWSQNR